MDALTVAELTQRSPGRATTGEYVGQRFYSVGRGDDVKVTSGLSTCIRVAVIGHYDNPNATGPDRFLAHVDDFEDPPLQGFGAAIRDAKQNGLTGLQAFILAPRPGVEDDSDDAEDIENRRAQIRQIVESLVGAANTKLDLYGEDEGEKDKEGKNDKEGQKGSWLLRVNADKSFSTEYEMFSKEKEEDDDSE